MAQATYDDLLEMLVQPGRLVQAPTDVAAGQSFPYGGTSLGATENGIILERSQGYKTLHVEEYGNEPARIIFMGEEVTVTVQFVQWNDSIAALFWPGLTVTGGTSSEKNIEWPGDNDVQYVGKDMAGSSIALLFAPEDMTNNIIFYARKAVPVGAPMQLHFSAQEKTVWECKFYCMRDDSINTGNARFNSRGFFLGDRRDLTI